MSKVADERTIHYQDSETLQIYICDDRRRQMTANGINFSQPGMVGVASIYKRIVAKDGVTSYDDRFFSSKQIKKVTCHSCLRLWKAEADKFIRINQKQLVRWQSIRDGAVAGLSA